MGAVVALCCSVGLRINVQRIIGTRLHARFTSDTAIIIKINNTVRSRIKCSCRAYFHTRRIGTMVTTMNRKFPRAFRKFTFLNVFHVGAIDANRHIVLTFASHGAGMASNAHSIIYNKSVIHLIGVSRIFGTGNINENSI